MTTCPTCRGDLHRSHRRGFADYVRSWWGIYPYRCKECEARVYMSKVTPVAKRKQVPAHDLVVMMDDEKPTAQVRIQAETHEDLQRVIHSLNEALLSHEVTAEKSYSSSQ